MPTVDIDGIATYYEIAGEGPPLLMFAPGGFDAAIGKWSTLGVYQKNKLLDHLPAHFRCILIDRRDSGRSGGRVEPVTWSDHARHAAGLLDHLQVPSAHLLGGCMGCCPVTAFAVRYPDRARSMVLFWPIGGARYRINAQRRIAVHLAYVQEQGLEAVVRLARSHDRGFGQDPRCGPWVSVIRSDDAFAEAFAGQDVDHYQLVVASLAQTLVDRDTAPGAEPEDLMRLDIATLVVPGADASHATSAARYLTECIAGADYWDLPVDEQSEDNVPDRIVEFLGSAEARFSR